ncbi:hypothetical protein [Microbulbifer epialgicus]|uniref:Uncharacterized protein n=1 Tax=Microbulbifer epialgicus TaxID=393907 RepID=A0ABV4NTG4_9GAMM
MSQSKEIPISIKGLPMDLGVLEAEVRKLEIKPFANDFFWVGDWCISANACGYFMSSKCGSKFSFRENEVEIMLGILKGIIEGTLNQVYCDYAASGVWIDGKLISSKINKKDVGFKDGDYFEQALIELNLQVKKYGRYTWRTEGCLVALVTT